MLYREIIAVCSDMNAKHKNAMRNQYVEFYALFAKRRKAIISLCMSVCLS
jgi:hypothetical protein